MEPPQLQMAPHLPRPRFQVIPPEIGEAPESPVQADLPRGAQQYLEELQQPSELPLDRLFDMHVQGDGAHPIARTGNSSIPLRNCSRTGHHIDIYCHCMSGLKLRKVQKRV